MNQNATTPATAGLDFGAIARAAIPPLLLWTIVIGFASSRGYPGFDELEYFREIRLLEEFRVTLALAGLAEDGSRFILRNEFWRADATLAAKVTSTGGWLDLALRKLVVPPEGLLAALHSLPRTEDFQMLPSSIKDRGG